MFCRPDRRVLTQKHDELQMGFAATSCEGQCCANMSSPETTIGDVMNHEQAELDGWNAAKEDAQQDAKFFAQVTKFTTQFTNGIVEQLLPAIEPLACSSSADEDGVSRGRSAN